ncbi:MAG: ferritin-like domain-containing protein [Acidimicrobiaceae bacterium]|nr:ferritin-like domain-containing protein [Ilumatobacter sp.]MCB9381244.1 ferritin-like domain-containing protein [Acidimicrobiaceae bacterium]MCO5330135.1 ferritin-like domain-containing protein [Ilumatobacteraceae bacterium]
MEIEVTQAGPAAASPRIGRRHVLGAGVGGAALSLLPFLAGRAQASAGDTTTTAPPLPPTDADVALLGQAQQIELTFVDLFETAIAAADWSDDEAAVMVEFREAHKEYAAALSALLGRHAPNTPSESLMGSLVAGFSGAKDGILSAAYDAESGAVAAHDEILGQLQGTNGAVLIASIQMAEARHCTALAALSGATDLAQLLVDDEADALQVNG